MTAPDPVARGRESFERQTWRLAYDQLPAAVEVMLPAGDVVAARATADELSALAADLSAPALDTATAHAGGAVTRSRCAGPGPVRRELQAVLARRRSSAS